MSDLSQAMLNDLISQCENERRAYRSDEDVPSPACIQLFRYAFAGEEDAWTAVDQLFRQYVRKWVGVQTIIEADDAIQLAFFAFFRSAPKKPFLVTTDSLALILGWLRSCTKSAVLGLLRKEPNTRHIQLVPLEAAADVFAANNVEDEVEGRLLRERIMNEVITNDQELLVYHCYFELGMKPKDIFDRYPNRFTDMQELRQVIQRLFRRILQFRRGDENP